MVLKPHYRLQGHEEWARIAGRIQVSSGVMCHEPGCHDRTQIYRQCANNHCKKDIAYCKQHGGDDRAMAEIQAHMKKEHAG